MIYGKQHNKNRTDHSDNLGLIERYLLCRSKGKLLQQLALLGRVSEQVKASTLNSYFIVITSTFFWTKIVTTATMYTNE